MYDICLHNFASYHSTIFLITAKIQKQIADQQLSNPPVPIPVADIPAVPSSLSTGHKTPPPAGGRPAADDSPTLVGSESAAADVTSPPSAEKPRASPPSADAAQDTVDQTTDDSFPVHLRRQCMLDMCSIMK